MVEIGDLRLRHRLGVIALVEGSFGFDLEVAALRQDGTLQHLWRDGAGWHEGVIIGSTK